MDVELKTYQIVDSVGVGVGAAIYHGRGIAGNGEMVSETIMNGGF